MSLRKLRITYWHWMVSDFVTYFAFFFLVLSLRKICFFFFKTIFSKGTQLPCHNLQKLWCKTYGLWKCHQNRHLRFQGFPKVTFLYASLSQFCFYLYNVNCTVCVNIHDARSIYSDKWFFFYTYIAMMCCGKPRGFGLSKVIAVLPMFFFP